jgi:hypothetical protein
LLYVNNVRRRVSYQQGEDLHWIEFDLFVDPFRIIITALQYRARPLRQKALCLSLDADLRPLAFGVKHNDFAYATSDKSILVHRQSAQCSEKITLNVVCGKRPIIQRFKEEFYRFEEVDLGINKAVDILIAV